MQYLSNLYSINMVLALYTQALYTLFPQILSNETKGVTLTEVSTCIYTYLQVEVS